MHVDNRRKILFRARLIKQLENNIQKKLTLLIAGGGWGKTSLVKSFAHYIDAPVMIQNIGAVRHNPEILITQFCSFFIALDQNLRSPLERISQGVFNDEGGNWLNTLRSIVCCAAESIRSPIVIVLDDYHTIRPEQTLSGALSGLMEYAPINCHFIVVSRSKPSFPVSRIDLYGEIRHVGYNDLKFTQQEIHAFFSLLHSCPLTDDEAKAIASHTDGWPVALKLFASSIGRHGMQSVNCIPELVHKNESIFQYFEEEILGRLSPDEKLFLMKTAFLDSFSVEICENVLGIEETSEKLDAIMKNDMVFLQDESGNLFQYHQFFKQYLINAYTREHGVDSVKKLNFYIAENYSKKGDWQFAMSHYLLSNSLGDASRLVEDNLTAFISMERADFLLKLLDDVPLKDLQKHAVLEFAKGWALYFKGRFTEARSLIYSSMSRFSENNRINLLGKSLQLCIMLNHSTDRIPDVIDAVEVHLNKFKASSWDYIFLVSQLAIAYMHSGDRPNAQKYWSMVESNPAIQDNYDLYMNTVCLKAVNFDFLLGNFESSIKMMIKAIAYFRENDFIGRHARFLLMISIVHFEMGSYEDGDETIMNADREMAKLGHHYSRVAVGMFSVMFAIKRGNLDAAGKRLEQMHKISIALKSHILWKEYGIYVAEACFAIETNHRETFLSKAEIALQKVNSLRQWMDAYWVYTSLAPGFIKCGESRKALSLLKDFHDVTNKMGAVYCEAHVHLLTAWAYHELDDQDEVVTHLSKALKIGDKYHFDFLFTKKAKEATSRLLPVILKLKCCISFSYGIIIRLNNSGEVLLPVLSGSDKKCKLFAIKSLADFECRESEKHLVKLKNDLDEEIRSASDSAIRILQSLPPYPLTVTAFGKFCIRQNGIDIYNRINRRGAAISVLQYFILNNGMKIPTDRLLELFFSSNNSREPRAILHQTMTALRTALEPGIAPKRKSSYIIADKTAYQFDLPDNSDVDVFKFEQNYKKAKTILSQNDESTALDVFKKAISLYQGDLFSEEPYQDWIEPIRQRIRSIFQECLHFVSNIQYKSMDYISCCRTAEHLVEIEPWNEKAYLILMKCNFQMGRRDKMISAYKRCKDILWRDLGIPPSEELTNFFQTAK